MTKWNLKIFQNTIHFKKKTNKKPNVKAKINQIYKGKDTNLNLYLKKFLYLELKSN